jgi:phage terminase large subunit-like protein
MSSKIPPAVETYLRLVESGKPRVCPEQTALAAYIRRVFENEDLIFEAERFEKYVKLQTYFPFELFPWEEFLIALWLCTYKAPGMPRWKKLFTMVGRGAGKDGLIGFIAFCAVSPYNPAKGYDVDICANDEEQAMRPVKDVTDVLDSPKFMTKLKKYFYHTKELIQGRKNRGVIKGRTNSPSHRDGMRSGMIVFNEVHAYLNYDNIKVFRTGLGKKDEPREGAFTSNGNISDGPLDDMLERALRILFGGEPDNGFLPFVCRLPKEEMVHDPENWSMANPSLQYMPTLMAEIQDEYNDWKDAPEEHGDFLTKRMGIRKGFEEITVTDYDKVKETNKPLPDMTGWSCTVGIDFAELSDFASVDLHFRRGEERFDINHTWICKQSKTLHRVRAPYMDWVKAGICTLVDDVSIHPRLLAEYIRQMGMLYNVKILCMDNFRWTVVADAMREIGFDASDKTKVKLVRPSDIMKADGTIQECFNRGLYHWGDNPCLRWAVNNTKRIRSGKKAGTDTGNYYYGKIEAKSRKTDPFMAHVAAMTAEELLGTGEPLKAPPIGAIRI